MKELPGSCQPHGRPDWRRLETLKPAFKMLDRNKVRINLCGASESESSWLQMLYVDGWDPSKDRKCQTLQKIAGNCGIHCWELSNAGLKSLVFNNLPMHDLPHALYTVLDFMEELCREWALSMEGSQISMPLGGSQWLYGVDLLMRERIIVEETNIPQKRTMDIEEVSSTNIC